MTVSFTVHGKPEPAGSKRGFVRGGKVIVTDANRNSRPWKALVTDAAIQAMMTGDPNGQSRVLEIGAPLEGPLRLAITFYVQRPKGHYNKSGLRPSAPRYPTVRPDLLKLARGVEDAMTGIIYDDDAQITEELLFKRYSSPTDHPRVEVTVRAAGDGDT